MIRRRSYIEAIGSSPLEDYTSDESEIVQETHFNRSDMSVYISTSSDDSEGEISRTKPQYDKIFKSENIFFSDNFHIEKQQFEMMDRSQSDRHVHVKNALTVDTHSTPKNKDNQSWNDVYNACLEYISNENIRNKKIDKTENFKSIHKMLNEDLIEADNDTDILRNKGPIKVDLMENRTSFHFNVDTVSNIADQSDLTTVNEELNSIPETSIETKVFSDIYTQPDEDDDDYNELKHNSLSEENSSYLFHYVGRNSYRKKRKIPENSGIRSRKFKRVIRKNGNTNVPLRQNIIGKSKIYLDDFATTLIECQWRWLTLAFSAANFFVWLGFALMFYVAGYANGDFEEGATNVPCVADGRTFTGIFTFSVESQVSIGYGEKHPNEICPEITFILMMEVIVGNALIGAMVSVVFAKIVRPQKHLKGVGFSRKALICMRDGKLCLVIRVWDYLEKHTIGTQIRGWFIEPRTTLPPLIQPIIFDKVPIILRSNTIQHVIDENSPLYDLSARDLLDKRFEIAITFTGSARSTGSLSQSRTSYLSHEVLWGWIFKEVISLNEEKNMYVIDSDLLDEIQPVDIPLCSARLLKHFNSALLGTGISVSVPGSPVPRPLDSPRSALVSPSWSFKVRKFRDNITTSLPG